MGEEVPLSDKGLKPQPRDSDMNILKILKIMQMGYYDGDLIRFSDSGTTGEGRIHTAHIRSENSW